MKKIASILFLLMATVVCFAQEEVNDAIQKPSKFASWTISDAFQAEVGFVGSHHCNVFFLYLLRIGAMGSAMVFSFIRGFVGQNYNKKN